MNAEYDKLAYFVQQSLGVAAAASLPPQQPSAGGVPVPDLLHSLSHAASMTLQMRPPAALPLPTNAAEQKRAACKRSPSDAANETNKKPHPSDTDVQSV